MKVPIQALIEKLLMGPFIEAGELELQMPRGLEERGAISCSLRKVKIFFPR